MPPAEFNVGYNGTDKFIGSKRYGWFPAGSLGWVIQQKNFSKKSVRAIDRPEIAWILWSE